MNGVANFSSLNKPIKINLNICIHIFYFLGWAKLSSHGLGLTQQARPGH